MVMLASDLMNPQFVGARNPDELLAVEFYWGIVKDVRGRPVLDEKGEPKRVPYVKIAVPGNDTSIVNTPVREEHKVRFRRQWDFWQSQELQGKLPAAVGWALEDWDEINDEQRRDLKFLRFTIVEQLAQVSDSTLQRVGPDGMSLKIRAQAALRKRAEELASNAKAAHEREMGELRAAIKDLQDQLAAKQATPDAATEEGAESRTARKSKAA